ncbi:ABC transporter permease [Streptomyces sp. 4N509B]|uniref:ABC transporter permease n=1 Tax=Streptomyces sp. 4N509B TaxID=3457413 RepID=UPI003FD1EA69
MTKVLSRILLPASGFALLLAAWYVVAFADVLPEGQMPRPDEVLTVLADRFAEQDLWRDVQLSVLRVLIGVAAGSAIALPVGFLLAWYRPLRMMFDPVISFFRALPPIALIPLVIVYLGIGEQARLSILIYAAFFASVVVIYEGIAALDEIYIRAARAMGASQWELFSRVVVPLAIPQVLVGIRVALGVCWATLVAAELIAARRGLGATIQDAANFFQIDMVYGGVVLIGICALVMDRALALVMKRAVRWQERVA